MTLMSYLVGGSRSGKGAECPCMSFFIARHSLERNCLAVHLSALLHCRILAVLCVCSLLIVIEDKAIYCRGGGIGSGLQLRRKTPLRL